MIADLKPYPKTKNSGVEWLGDVPDHWDVRRLRNLAEMRVSNVDKHTKDDEETVRLCNYTDVYKNDYIRPSMSLMRATATKDEIARFHLEADDVLITKDSESWNDIGVPALVVESTDDLLSGYHLALLRPFADRIAGGYLLRAVQSRSVQYQFHVEANGVTRYGLSHAAIKSVWLPMPPLPEQATIVRYLDYVDRRVRRLVRAKRKLIALLTEQKQAIIHRAVTRGLDPNVPLKDSGVEWLGEIPAHWEVQRLGRISRIFNGSTPSRLEPAFWRDGTVPWLSSSKVNDSLVTTESEFVTNRAVRECSISLVPKGAVIIGLVGQGKTRGKATILGIEACISQNIAAIVTMGSISGTYLKLFLTAFYPTVREFGRGGNQEALNCEIVSNLRISLPHLHEQCVIFEKVDSLVSRIAEGIERANREIELLNEYRTRLIADVVTGKLDVREAAAALPEVDPLADDDNTDDVLETDADAEAETDDLDATSEETDA